MALKDTLRLVCTHPIFLHLSKVPSVSVSEISHIPISRCSAVSRLDRIRTLWCSMSPLGVWNKQRCVAPGTVGHRTAPGSWYRADEKRAFLNFRGRKVHMLHMEKEGENKKKKIKKMSTSMNYITLAKFWWMTTRHWHVIFFFFFGGFCF